MEEKYEVVKGEEEGVWLVVNKANGQTYIVRPQEGYCSCPDFNFRRFQSGELCKHLKMVRERLGLDVTPPVVYREIPIAPTEDAKRELEPLLRAKEVVYSYVYKVNDYVVRKDGKEYIRRGWVELTADGLLELAQFYAAKLGKKFDMEEPRITRVGDRIICFVKCYLGDQPMIGYADEPADDEFAYRHVVTHALAKATRRLIPLWVRKLFIERFKEFIRAEIEDKKERIRKLITTDEIVQVQEPETGAIVELKGLGGKVKHLNGELKNLNRWTIFNEDKINELLAKVIEECRKALPEAEFRVVIEASPKTREPEEPEPPKVAVEEATPPEAPEQPAQEEEAPAGAEEPAPELSEAEATLREAAKKLGEKGWEMVERFCQKRFGKSPAELRGGEIQKALEWIEIQARVQERKKALVKEILGLASEKGIDIKERTGGKKLIELKVEDLERLKAEIEAESSPEEEDLSF